MTTDIAVFLDLDNLVIGAKQLNLDFDINLILDHLAELLGGRIVLRRAYGDWRQNKKLLEELTAAGFTTQSTMRINKFGKNLADMQIVVDTMDSLIDGHHYGSYVFMTGDRDFTPLVQSLHKRGKHVVGMGVKHAASRSLVNLCDHYIFYDDLIPAPTMTEAQIEELLVQSLDHLLANRTRVRASVLKQHLNESSSGAFDTSPYSGKSFRKFLNRFPHLVDLQQEGTTIYVRRPKRTAPSRPLHLRYRTGLKRQRLRVVPADQRLAILKAIIRILAQSEETRWRQLIDTLATDFRTRDQAISNNNINAVMLVAREAEIILPMKGNSLATAPVLLQLKGNSAYREAIVRCDAVYLRAILDLSDFFDLKEAALALYDNPNYACYLQKVIDVWMSE
jgi:uncharacterized LabA/DUF88 family protein